MNLDTDGNPSPHASARPSDAPPRRQPAPDDGAAARVALARAILATLPLDVRAVLGAILAAWFATLAAVARSAHAAKRAAPVAANADVAAALASTARAASEALSHATHGPGAYEAAAALAALWCDAAPFDAAEHAAQGYVSAAELDGFAAELAAALDGSAGQTGAEGVAAPHRTPAEAPSKSSDTGDATTAAPRVIRCPLPAGVARLDTPAGVTFLPPDAAPTSSAARDPYLRAILAGAGRGRALVTALSVAAWARTLAALGRGVEASALALAAAPRPDCTTGDGLARALMATAPRELARAAAQGATAATLAGVDDSQRLWRALTASWFALSPAELAEIRADADDLDAFAAELDAFAAGDGPDAPAAARAAA